MDRIDIVKDILAKRELAIAEGDNRVKVTANKSLYTIINDSIKKAKSMLGEDNSFKEYLINNKENIKEQLAINKEVDTVAEAMALINKIDFRYIYGFDVLIEEVFQCPFVTKDQTISFAVTSSEEANEALEKEMMTFVNREIDVSEYVRFGMYVVEIKVKGETTEAWISYSNIRNKCVYIIGDKSKDSNCGNIIFDIFDLYQIFMTCDIRRAIQDLSELLGVSIKEIETIKEKYEGCRAFLKTNLIKGSFPTLYELIGEHIPKLDTILEEGIDKLYYHVENKTDWIFSSSMEYLSIKMNKSKSTINPIVNTFALLGLLEKPEVNSGIYYKWNRNAITYFYIPEYNEELFLKAEQSAKLMLYSGERVTASSFSYIACTEKFGEEIANLIFKDKVTKTRAS